ncbi:MAG: aspartyl protease family protein [Mediterranea sp.]|jgi:predicted aspartyl protease|nr:aspartyl protease family protein [Mediterranea sp.]
MKLLKLLACLLLPAQALTAQVNADSVRITLQRLEQGLKQKDITLLTHQCFAPDYSISTYTTPSADGLLRTIAGGVEFEAVHPDSELMEAERDTAYLYARFATRGQQKEQRSVIAFNRQARILFIDYFDQLFGDSRYRPSRLVATLPFRLDDGAIVLQARLNKSDRPLAFLLDTGADGMAIRRTLADSLGLTTSHAQDANVVGGRKTVSISAGNTLRLTDSLSLEGQNIALFEQVRHGLDGIIGLNLLKRYITRVDFDRQTLSLYSFGNYAFPRTGTLVPVQTPQSLILLPSELNLTGRKSIAGRFIMDTGANYELIAFSRFVRKNRLLLSGFKPEGSGSTVSLGHATPVYYGHAASLQVGDIKVQNLPVTLQASNGNDQSAPNGPDGSVGIGFFGHYNFTVDLLRKVVHLEERSRTSR